MAKGRFIPKNPQKYLGNVNNIIFRSSWELTCLKFFDSSSAVMKYASEEIAIPYVSIDGRVHRYYPDFLAKIINAQGVVEDWLLEVKPLKESNIDFAKTAYDKLALAKNEAKWKAAQLFANANNMKFKVITEIEIYKLQPPKPRKAKDKVKTAKPKTIKPRTAKGTTRVKPVKRIK
jgi:hypothetical protein